MTSPTGERNGESADRTSRRWPGFGRRPLLKALGAGAALSLGSGAATADDEHGDGDDADGGSSDDAQAEARGIHPTFGLALAADEDVPDGIDPAQVVELDVAEDDVHEGFPLRPDPENPEEFVESDEEFVFDPVGMHLTPGDIVHYDNLAHLHTVTAFHEKFGGEMFPMPTRVPEGTPGFTSPIIVDDEGWLYEFSEPGVYDVLCLPHLTFGMVQRVVVSEEGQADVAAPTAMSEEVPPNAVTVLTAPELDPQHIVENGPVAWGDLTLETQPSGETETPEG